jgi:hypothetical protein
MLCRKKEVAVFMGLPEFSHGFQKGFRERNESFLVAFANDPKDHSLGIDGLDLKAHRFTDAKSAEIHQLKTKAVVWFTNGGKESKELFVGYSAGQTLLAGHADFFFVNRFQFTSRV